jgi:hypothetical protein
MDYSNCKNMDSSIYTNEVNRCTTQLFPHPTSPVQLCTLHLSWKCSAISIPSSLIWFRQMFHKAVKVSRITFCIGEDPSLNLIVRKVKLSPSTTWRNIGELEVNLHSVLTSTFHDRFTPSKEPRYVLERRKVSFSYLDSKPGRSSP